MQDTTTELIKDTTPIFTNDTIVFGILMIALGFIFYTSSREEGFWKKYLSKLKNYSLEKIAPGHGELMPNPYEVAEWIIQHRAEREGKVVEALKKTKSGDIDSLVSQVYEDVDSSLHPIAKWSLESHLIKLQEEGKVLKKDSKYFLI